MTAFKPCFYLGSSSNLHQTFISWNEVGMNIFKSMAKVTRVIQNFCHVCSVAPCLFDGFASYLAQIQPMKCCALFSGQSQGHKGCLKFSLCPLLDGFIFVLCAVFIVLCWTVLDRKTIVFNPLWPSDDIWQYWFWSTLAQVMACCLTAPSHYLNQCWLIITSQVQWHSSEGNFTWDTSACNN